MSASLALPAPATDSSQTRMASPPTPAAISGWRIRAATGRRSSTAAARSRWASAPGITASAAPLAPPAPGNGQFHDVDGVAIPSGRSVSGTIWVTDANNNRMEKFNSSGTFIMGIGDGYNGVSGAIGSSGSGNGQFNYPTNTTIDASGNVWVPDQNNNRVEEFTSSGAFIMGIGAGYNGVSGSIGSSGSGNGQLNHPDDVAIDSSGNVWVFDNGNNRMEEFNSSGAYVSQFGSYGSGNGQFHGPWGFAIDAGGNIWVADTSNHRVEKFNNSGTFLLGIGAGYNGVSGSIGSSGSGNGQFNQPSSIAFDASGNVWVTDMNNSRVEEFNSSGTYITKFGSNGSGNGQLNNPNGIAFDANGNIWVLDNGNNRVEEFNSSGTYMSKFGSTGSGNGQFANPNGLAIVIPSCTLPWGGLLANGLSGTSYAVASVAYGSTCTADTDTCTAGVLSNGDQYGVCTVLGPGSCTLPWGGAINSGSTSPAYSTGAVSSPASCPAANTISCTNGTLSCSTGSVAANCEYEACSVITGACNLPWGGFIESGQNVTAYQAATEAWNAGGSCVSSQTRTCTDGTLSGTYTFQACTLNPAATCTLSASQGGATLNGATPGNTQTEYAAGVAATCTANTITCTNGTLSCSDGIIGDCSYASCTGYGIWVADFNHNRIEEFNTNGLYVTQFGSSGSGNGQFSYPTGVAIDASGNIWVVDYGNNRVEEFNSSGTFLSKFGSSGSGNGQFSNPIGIALDSSGNVWVADQSNNRVEKFNSSGVYQMAIGDGYNGVSGAIGSHGSGNGQFYLPTGIAIDASGNVWVLDENNERVEEFNSSGTYVSKFGSSGSGNGQFWDPYLLVTDASGNFWVTDFGEQRVEEFNSSGVFQMGIGDGYQGVGGSIGSHGSGNGQFYDPTGIAIDTSGNVWVADYLNDRVQEFNSSGTYVSQFGSAGVGNGQFNGPYGIAMTPPFPCVLSGIQGGGTLQGASPGNTKTEYSASSGSCTANTLTCTNGTLSCSTGNMSGCQYSSCTQYIYLADGGNYRVQEFNSSGTYVSQFGSSGSGNGQFGSIIRGVAVDASGNVWVAEYGNNRMQEFNSSGTYLSKFGSPGSGNGQFNAPADVAIDASGNLWVAESLNYRVQEFNNSGTYLSQFGSHGSGNGQFNQPRGIAIDASGNLWVTDQGNDTVQEFNSSGSFLLKFGSIGSGNGQFNNDSLVSVAIDASGNIWVTDDALDRVQEFNSSGTYLSQFGSPGSGNGQFNGLRGIAIH